MKFTTSRSEGVSGPSNSIGIMRFFDTDLAGPKITPEFIIIACIIFSGIVVAIHLMK